MKKHFLSMLAIGALTLAGCSNDDFTPQGGENNTPAGEPVGYMGFTIATDASRAEAGDWNDGNDDEVFNDGSVNEYALAAHQHAHIAVFFDAAGNYYGSSYLTPYSKDDDNGHGETHPSVGDKTYPEHFYTYITRWRNADQKALPTQVVVLINEVPTDVEALKATWDETGVQLNDLLKRVNEKGGIFNYGGSTFFTMSNSVYLGTDGLVQATQIENGKICATVEEALANRVTVYVERLLAKHTLTYGESQNYVGLGGVLLKPSNENKKFVKAIASYTGEEESLDWPDTDDVEWGAYLVGWNMNGLEQNEFTFKQLKNQDYFDGVGKLNNADYHRSYWAESANYDKGTYPSQYRPYTNESLRFDPEEGYNWFKSAEECVDDYTLRYITYNEIFGQNVYTKTGNGEDNLKDFPVLNGEGNHRYSVERTYDVTRLHDGDKGYSPYRQATHFLVAANLVMAGEMSGNTVVDPEGITDKYYAYNWYWTGANAKEDYIRYSYRRLAGYVADGLEHTFNGVDYEMTESSKNLYFANNDESVIEVKDAANYFDTTEALLYHGDGKVVITPKENVKVFVKARVADSDEFEFVELTAELTSLIYEHTDAARHYNKGAMYYAIPVQHMHGHSNYGTDYANRVTINKYNGYPAGEGEVERGGDPYTTGQFGVVRNNWYRVNINNINNVGTPVDDPDQPIIPDPEDEWAVAFEIVVLPWHVIDMGDVDL